MTRLSKEIRSFTKIREVFENAVKQRYEYTTTENIRNLERLLRGKGRAREVSNLARTLQRAIDAGTDSDVLSEVTEPTETRNYDKIK